ncbi:MAG: hypothetical protein H6706_17955 [Myxococcales bacterium]|nr:hypothetical protein [Myxococcales bacterium]
MLRFLSVLVLGLAATGCAQQCRKVTADREAFLAREVAPTPAPHLSVRIPQALIDDAIAAGLKRLVPQDVALPGLGQLAQYVSAIKVLPDRLAMERVANGRFRISMDLDVQLGGRSLFKMAAASETEPVADLQAGTVELALRPDMIQSVVPSVPGDAAAKLTDALVGQVPAAVRALVPRNQIQGIAQQAIQTLTTTAFDAIRRSLLTPMGELARFRFELPDLPLAALALVSEPGGLRIDARTTLPVVAGLAEQALASPGGSDRVEVRFAAQTLVELVNHAISKGNLPGNYDLQGNPAEGGSVLAALGWATGARPLKVDLWTPTGLCMRARIGATPELSLASGALSVGVKDAEVELVDGPPLVQQATAWAERLWGNAAGQGEGKARGARLSLGKGAGQGFGLADVNLAGDTLVLGLRVGGNQKQAAVAQGR